MLGALSMLISTADVYANLEGRWVQHPAAALRTQYKESQVDRIIDGNRYVYFSVRGAAVDRGTQYLYTTGYESANHLEVDPIQIFRYDKTKPWSSANITAVARDMELSGVLPVTLNYSPKWGVFAVVYENRSIDFIYDDGTLVCSKALENASVPNSGVEPYSVTFDEDHPSAYIAGSFGYACIDLASGELKEFHKFDKSLSWAARIGDNMVVFAGTVTPLQYSTQTYVFPIMAIPSVLSKPVAGADNLQALMPMGDNSFAAMAQGSADTQNSVRLYTINNGEVSSSELAKVGTVDNGSSSRYRHMFRTDGYFNATSKGYAVFNNADIILLERGVPASEMVKTISKGSLATNNEKNAKASTADGKRVWFYTYETAGLDASERGFYFRDNSNGSWSDKSQVFSPNAPTSSFIYYGAWNPEHGFMLRGPGSFENNGSNDRDQFCGYNNGIWTDLSYSANNEKYSNNAGTSDPTLGAKYVNIDPLNPHWVWGGTSYRGGLFRMDLSDFSNYFAFGLSTYSSWKTTYPGYFNIFPPEWMGQNLQFANVDFDSNNTMWFSRYLANSGRAYYDYEDLTLAYEPLYYMTAEERMQIRGDQTDEQMLKKILDREIRVPRTYSQQASRLIALKSQGCGNIIAFSHKQMRNNFQYSFLYDHKGTLDNTEDDVIAYFDEFYDENGDKIYAMKETGLYEDTYLGEVWLCTDSGPYILNPLDYLGGNKTVKRPRIEKREGLPVDENPFEQISVFNITEDYTGRKWLATNGGLFCLTKDNKELLGHYTTLNSPIPSDEVFNVISNNKSGSLMVATSRGLAEFFPEGTIAPVEPGEHLSVWPASIHPDYNGYVNIMGCVEGAEYEVCALDGKPVLSLGTPESGVIQWNGLDSANAKLPAGKYIIKRKGMDESHPVIIM